MGYTTDFKGRFNLNKPLTEAQARYLKAFANTRRMQRDINFLDIPDPFREAVGLSLGEEGGHFVGGGGLSGQYKDSSVINYNRPPIGQPTLWCQWIPTEDLEGIEWDRNEKFYDYVKWLVYIIEHFLVTWDLKLNGEIQWFGEVHDDMGKIVVTNNLVKILKAKIVYE